MGEIEIKVTLVEGALGAPAGEAPSGAGAWVVFEGVVRPIEGDARIDGLDYEVYEPMATRQLERLAREVGEAHGVMAMLVEHSRGFVGVGACSFRLSVGAAHRGPALGAMGVFIDRMKRDVPIWKRGIES